tara:strand:- start:11014 stop:12174 length:1161 start_codon:yes stop_codon:yes gene_type:complete
MSETLALHEPTIAGSEWKYVKDCLDTGWVSSAGKYVDLFETSVCEYTGAKHGVACVNGTSALQISLQLAGVGLDDEVIVPTLTFIASVNAVFHNNARPIFMDADDHYNIDSEKTIDFIKNKSVLKNGFSYNKDTGRRIKAIVPVHVFGNAVCLHELVQLCEERNIAIVEDAAESMGSHYLKGFNAGRHTGTIGMLGCLSFNGNKIITTGGGGMILTNDSALAEKARYLITQAKDDGINYVHNEVGYNFRMTNIAAALGVGQLEQLPVFLERKRKIFSEYSKALENIPGLSLGAVPNYASNNHWMNILKIEKCDQSRNPHSIMRLCENSGIQTRPVWALNHSQRPYRHCQTFKIEKATELVEGSLCLPSSSNVSTEQVRGVLDILSW